MEDKKRQEELEKKYRVGRLIEVHKHFDLDNGGSISKKELQALGEARRSLGQKSGSWSKEQNDRLISKIDKDGDGEVDANEFSTHFHENLPKPREEFDTLIEQFMTVRCLPNRCVLALCLYVAIWSLMMIMVATLSHLVTHLRRWLLRCEKIILRTEPGKLRKPCVLSVKLQQ